MCNIDVDIDTDITQTLPTELTADDPKAFQHLNAAVQLTLSCRPIGTRNKFEIRSITCR